MISNISSLNDTLSYTRTRKLVEGLSEDKQNQQSINLQNQTEFLQSYESKDKAYNPLDYGFKRVDPNDYAEFTHFDTAKTLQNVYKLFSQLMSKLEYKESYTKEELLQNFPFAFEFDKKTLEITKTYTFDELKELRLAGDKTQVYISFVNPWQSSTLAEDYKLEKNENIFSYYGMDIGSKLYTQEDGTITKMGIFHAFATRFSNLVAEGQTSIRGKLLGLDRSLSQESVDDLKQFLERNKLGNGEIFIWVDSNDKKAYEKLLNSNLSIEDFKEKYLEFKAYVEAKQEKWLNKNSIQNDNPQSNLQNKTFTPIEAKSSSQTYEGVDTNSVLKKLLLDKFNDKDFLKMLFGENNKEIKSPDFLTLRNKLNTKNIDIKA